MVKDLGQTDPITNLPEDCKIQWKIPFFFCGF